MDENRENLQNTPNADGPVVFFSPEMLKLADEKRRQTQERLDECRQAAEEGDASAQVQMALNCLYGTAAWKRIRTRPSTG